MSVEMTKIACKVLQKFDGKPVSCYAVAAENRSQKRSDLMIKAAIFDLDGTIGDTVESIAYSANRALRDIGYQAFPGKQTDNTSDIFWRDMPDRTGSLFLNAALFSREDPW